MEQYYKSTIVVYSKHNWDGMKLSDLVLEACNPLFPESICSSWKIEEVEEEQVVTDPEAGQDVLDYLQGSSAVLDDDYWHTNYSDDEYEFYNPDEE